MAGPNSNDQRRAQPTVPTAAQPVNAGNGTAGGPPPLPSGKPTSPVINVKSAAPVIGAKPPAAQSVASQTPAKSVATDLTPRPRSRPPGSAPKAIAASAMAKPLSRPIPIARPAGALPVTDDDEEPAPATHTIIRSAPPWLVSMVVHMLLLLIMALIVVAQHRKDDIQLFFSDRIGDPLAFDDLNMDGDPALEAVEIDTTLPQVSDPFAAPPKLDISLEGLKGFTPSSETTVSAPQFALAFSGRDDGMRQALSRMYGGDALSDDAVIKGLAWLAKQQRKDGSWSLTGPYTLASGDENRSAATGMALLAFLGNGNTHNRGTYKLEVDRGVKYLLKIQKRDGDLFVGENRKQPWLYSHAQCTIVLCELYAMTHDSRLREPAERAVQFAVEAQGAEGGWKYWPKQPLGDTSVSGWIMMALQSARMAGLAVPQDSLDRFSGYLDAAQDKGGSRYGYEINHQFTKAMTAEGLLCRQYLGWSQSDPRLRDGAEYLTSPENLPNWADRDVYYWYYATQMLHHMEGQYWIKWNDVMKPLLVKKQVNAGLEMGSWSPFDAAGGDFDQWGAFGGRLYVTCLSIYILEVYYRHLPLYTDASKLGIP